MKFDSGSLSTLMLQLRCAALRWNPLAAAAAALFVAGGLCLALWLPLLHHKLASRQIAETVNAAIESLSDDLRQAITLREIEGLSYEDIADMMNCPIGTVRSRIFRAREAISARLRPLLDARQGGRW